MRGVACNDEEEHQIIGRCECGLLQAFGVPQARFSPPGANIRTPRENTFELNLHNCSDLVHQNLSLFLLFISLFLDSNVVSVFVLKLYVLVEFDKYCIQYHYQKQRSKLLF